MVYLTCHIRSMLCLCLLKLLPCMGLPGLQDCSGWVFEADALLNLQGRRVFRCWRLVFRKHTLLG